MVAEELCETFALRLYGGQIEFDLAVASQGEGEFGVRHGEANDRFFDLAELCDGGAHEFSSDGDVEEEVAHLDRGSDGAARGDDRSEVAPFAADDGAFVGVGDARRESQVRDFRDRREGFPAKAEGRDAEEVVWLRNLTRRVRGKRQGDLVAGNPAPVVDDLD